MDDLHDDRAAHVASPAETADELRRSCAICGGETPYSCECPECRTPVCDACYDPHLLTDHDELDPDDLDDLDDLAAHVADELASADGGGQPAPMSDERLAEIRSRHEQTPGSSLAKTQHEISYAFFDRAELLAEVERQRVERAATLAERERLLAVVRAVVSLPPNGSLIEPIYITRETYMQVRAALAAAEGERA